MNVAKLVIANQEMDLKKDLSFGLNYSIDDVRKIEKKNGNYSKTVVLAGSKLVNKLMGGLFDVNADFTFFNPNFKTDAKIVVNSSTVIEGSMQLKSIVKTNNGTDVEYNIVVISSSSTFMADIKDKMLDELDLSDYDHDYTKTNIQNSWTNTEGFVYPAYWRKDIGGSNYYYIEDFKPAIFYKTYLERIARESGYTLGGTLMDDTTVDGSSLAKEIIPFSGKLPLITEAEYTRRKFRAAPTVDTQFANGTLSTITYSVGRQYFSDEGDVQVFTNDSTGTNFDNGSTWNTASSKYTIDAIGNYSLSFQVDTNIEFSTASIEAYQGSYTNTTFGSPILGDIIPNNSPSPFAIYYRLTKNGSPFGGIATVVIDSPIATGSASTFNAGNSYTVNTSGVAAMDFSGLNLAVGDEIELTYQVASTKNGVYSQYLTTYETTSPLSADDITRVPISWAISAKASSSFIFNTPNASALAQGDDIFMSSFIPTKIKQTDLFNDLVKRYNAYVSIDPDNDHKIILDTRDAYYDKGEVLDWSELEETGGKETIKLLAELQTKETLFTYKKASDEYNTSYFNSTDQIYGQKKISFLNDFAKGEKKIESIFTPTVLIRNKPSLPAMIVSAWNTDSSKNKGFTVMYYDGLVDTIENRNFYVSDIQSGSLVWDAYTTYPYAGHLDTPYAPNVDLNFGETAYSNYTEQTSTTDATLYNRFWRNYINQIDDGKLVTKYFDLNEVVIDKIRKNLNVKIWTDTSYYLINKIVDYDPITNKLTKVELLKIKGGVTFTGAKTPKVIGDTPDNPFEEDAGRPDGSTEVNELENSNTILDGVIGGFAIGTEGRLITQNYEGWIGNTHYLNGVVVMEETSMLLSEIFSLRDAGNLVTGSEYIATDFNYSFRAISTTEIDTNGTRVFQVVKPSLYLSDGIFDSATTYSVGGISIWGGKVWVSKLATTSFPTDYLTLDGNNWTLSADINHYENKVFSIVYSEALDSITEQTDDKGNTVFLGDGVDIIGYTSGDGFEFSDWSNPKIKNNRCSIFINNRGLSIEGNDCLGIVNNKTESSILRNKINGNIAYNATTGIKTLLIQDNINNGDIHYNTCSVSIEISSNDNNGGIGDTPDSPRTVDLIGDIVNL